MARTSGAAGPTIPPSEKISVALTVNGVARQVKVAPWTTLLDVLRDHLDLTGTKKGCDQGQCGACTVLADRRRIISCLTLAVMKDGAEATTIEGLAADGALHALQQAFIEHDAFQCGYYTPGQICSAAGLIAEGKATSADCDSRALERQHLPLRRLSQLRGGDPAGDGAIMIYLQYARATDVAEAVRLIASDPNAKFIAGGTNLIDLMKEDVEQPTRLIDISRLPLNSVEETADGGVLMGALVPNSDLAYHPLIARRYPMLASAILAGASAQLRNMASAGGALPQRARWYYYYDTATSCNKREPGSGCSAIAGLNRMHAILGTSEACIATHPSDMCVAFAALDATVHVARPSRARAIAFSDFHRLPENTPQRDTNLQPNEIITAVELPARGFTAHHTYLKIRDRLSFSFALVSVAAALAPAALRGRREHRRLASKKSRETLIRQFVIACALFGLCDGARAVTKDVDITVTHTDSGCSGPTVAVDKAAYAAGDTINVILSCGPGNQKDWLALNLLQGGTYTYVYVNGATNGTFSLQAPNVKSDRDLPFQVSFYVNDTYQRLASSPHFVVQKTVTNSPSQFLPAHLAADPFTPQHVSTVCLSGCGFTSLGNAISNAGNNNWDFVQIKISAGEYPYPPYAPTPGGSCPSFPNHVWIKGISPDGVSFPHIYGDNAGFGVCNGLGSVTVDNVEFGPSTTWMLGPRESVGTFTLRNVYVHDTAQALHTGAYGHNPMVLNFYNSVIARSGGPNGPAHDVYAENDTVNVINSVFEQPIIGHAFKTRATNFTANCSMFLVNQDDLYKGTETIDFPDGGIAHVMNSLSDSGAGAGVAWGNYSAWDNMRYGAEESPPYTKPVNTPILGGNLLLRDDPNVSSSFFSLYMNVTPTPPVTWTNNRFVFAAPTAVAGWGSDSGAILYNTDRGVQLGQAIIDSSNKVFTSRHDAGLPDVGSYPKGWRDFLPLMPAACTDPIGLVKIPNN